MSVEMNTISTQKPVVNNGNSLSINLTKEFRALGVNPGDWISITISKIESEPEDEDEYSMD